MSEYDYEITGMSARALTLRRMLNESPADGPPRPAVKHAPPFLMEPGERVRFLDDQPPHMEYLHQGTITRRLLDERLTHLRDRMPSDDQAVPAVPALAEPWVHGVPPLRPAGNRDRLPTEGKRQYDEIFLAESEDFAGDVAVHFTRGTHETVVEMSMADFLNLQAAVTDPAKPVTRRQVRGFLQALLASETGISRADWSGRDYAMLNRIIHLLEEA